MFTSKRRGKEKNRSLLLRNFRFAKIRHIGDYFADWGCKIRDGFTDFRVAFCVFVSGDSCLFFEL
ncbi:MAG: hypothetical protein DBY16_11495 [Coprobacter sp.]|nr:MAG: hypothetical protein DBY16_11495 [Coprobacter sp.]